MLHRKLFRYSIIFTGFLVFPQFLLAQSDSGNVTLIASLIVIGALILVSAIVTVSENLLQIEAKKYNLDSGKRNVSLFPRWSELFGSKSPEYTGGQYVHNLTKGYNINLAGKPSEEIFTKHVSRFAVRPTNFRGIAPIPKLVVAEGDEVKAGDELFYDKANPKIKYCAPVSGEVVEIRRGAKRAITEVIILADKTQKYKSFKAPDTEEATRQDTVEFLIASGVWPLINERPYDVVPDPERIPDNIFISTFDTAPLSPDFGIFVDGNESAFQKGLDVLSKLTSGNVHLGLNAGGLNPPHAAFKDAKNVKKHWFAGKHPAGNVGVQIHHVSPIRPGSVVWTADVQSVIAIGRLYTEGKLNLSRLVAIGGSFAQTPGYFKTVLGANIGDLIGEVDSNARIISGDVLTGRKVGKDDFLDANADQISIIEEGDKPELFGWLLPLEPRPTISKTFPNFLYPNLEFEGNTNTHGEKRAFVVTGEYEKVFPMRIFPQHLMKAIITNDFEQMEGLGIHELSEEDVALCEFVCTSKMPLQSILRDGLELMREQG